MADSTQIRVEIAPPAPDAQGQSAHVAAEGVPAAAPAPEATLAPEATPAPAPEAAPASDTAPASDMAAERLSAEGRSPQPQPGPQPVPMGESRLMSWLGDAIPRNRYAVVGGLFGLVAALLLFWIGIVKTLVIVVLVVAGVACGQYLDGDPKLIRLLEHLTRRR